MTGRYEYRLELKDFNPVVPPSVGISWRNPSPNDSQILAELMLDAYRDTIDYDGETIDDALSEVQSYFSGTSNPARLESSWLAFVDNELVCACLISFWNTRNVPLIAYVMTSAQAKGKQFAGMAVSRSLQSLIDQGHSAVRAVITAGNIPSEKVFTKLGFARLTSS